MSHNTTPDSDSPATDSPRKPQPRRVSARDWVPDQPGAWAMALLPALAGLVAGATFGHLTVTACWLFICWALCYCVEFAAARWLKSRCARRYLPPVIGYGIPLAVAGIPFVVVNPSILAWAPVYIVLAILAFCGAWTRNERSLWANAVAIIAACLMPTLAFSYCTDFPPASDALSFLDLPLFLSLPGATLTIAFAVVQFGSVLFVKTMIRERGSRAYLAASWIWHALVLLWWAATGNVSLAVLAVILLARAVALPLIARRRRVRPIVTGIVECATSLASFILILCSLLVM